MTTVSTKAIAKIAAVATGLAMAVSLFALAPSARAAALSNTQIDAIISLLSSFGADAATIANVKASLTGGTPTSGGSMSSSSCYAFSADLTVGSTGAAVTALQNALIGMGYSIPAGATGYFGEQTRMAVAAWQTAKGVSPAAGYFGAVSRAAYASACSTTGSTTGGSTTTPTASGLEGGAGSIDSFDEISSFSSEQVGEEEEDVEVAGIEIENGDDSDIELTAVRLDFSTQPSNDDLGDFITEVSIWLDGEEVARLDADEFNDDNDWTKTVTLDDGAIIRMGETAELTVGVSGVSNIDSADAGDDWAVDFVSVRYVDALGASITDNTDTTAFTWDVNTFATAADIELKALVADDTPEGVVNVDDTDDTDGVELLTFTLEAEGGDIEIKDLPITFATTSGQTADTLADIAATVYLVIDGEEFAENTTGAVAGASGATVTFDDIDFTIEEGDEVEVVVKADINDTEASVFVDGDAITASFTAENRATMDAEDETGEDLAAGDKTGTASGEAVAFYDIGIMVTFVSADETLTAGADGTADDDTVNLEMTFDVEAFDGTVYVSNAAAPTVAADGGVTAIDMTAAAGILYRYEIDGTATVALISDTVSKSNTVGTIDDDGVDEYTFEDGEKARITVQVTRANATTHVDSDGYHEFQLVAIGWSTTNADTTANVYEFDLDADGPFQTGKIFAN